jgi:hypothetical protein
MRHVGVLAAHKRALRCSVVLASTAAKDGAGAGPVHGRMG